MADHFAFLDATAQATLVRAGDCTPIELVEAAIERIEQLNPQLNAVIHKLYDKARAAATSPDLPNGPFRGVPFLVKDIVAHTAGDPYHCGMRFLKERSWVEPSDTWLAAKYRAAGFIFVGKTNTPELASSFFTEPVAYGATHNPWSLDYSTGGSSGGSAAAVASGMVPAAHGNDMGGSIRVPSSECGLVGLKPSRARNSLGPDFGEYWAMLTHEHVLTRSVRDTAAILDSTAGLMPGDPYTAPPPARPWRDEVGADPGRLRIGLTTAVPGNPTARVHADCATAVDATGRLLETLGHHVELAAPPLGELPQEAMVLFGVVVARELDRWSERTGHTITADDVEPWNWALAEMGRRVTATQYIVLIEQLQAFARRVAAWWTSGFDVLVTPTLPQPPPRLGSIDDIDMSAFGAFTVPFNITGQPAVSLPLHWNNRGLPIGVQCIAAYAREDVLIRLASQLEQAQPWSTRRPPVHA